MSSLKEYVTVTEAAESRGLTRQAILAVIKRGTLPATRVGNQWLIHRKDLAVFKANPGGRPPGVRRTQRSRNR